MESNGKNFRFIVREYDWSSLKRNFAWDCLDTIFDGGLRTKCTSRRSRLVGLTWLLWPQGIQILEISKYTHCMNENASISLMNFQRNAIHFSPHMKMNGHVSGLQ